MIRVLIVDDHPVFREGLRGLLAALDSVEVVGAVADGEHAVTRAAQDDVDVVLMDLNLPGMSGVEATRAITDSPRPPAVLVVTMVDDDDTVVAAMRAGARGYVLKGATGDEIGAAVQAVASGGAVFGAGVARRILERASSPAVNRPSVGGQQLTERETQILQLLADGHSNAQIARRLQLSHKTVQNYVSRILDKLQVSDRTQAALLAQRLRNGNMPH
jgi:DNA-binding NarL/FixJ family response regulator